MPLPVAEEGSPQDWQKPNEHESALAHEVGIVGFNWPLAANLSFSAKRRQVSTCRLLLFTYSLFTIP